ncbi:hypothetical protein SAMN05216509_0471 [Pseudomonas sp. B10]|uniref:hypothetical protein n=1 Tax=Pseudomonas TaxID=286 RepID=UPI00059C7CF5|nr:MULTISPECIES: hypothetical protein [Pseudomonas]AMT89004.1 hypothetical protein AYO71_16200 [Pseudomonas koreensis]MBB4059497.1 hypothetical protein [Pseudomonas koreensis]MBV4467640.1 hypothetical protein [Pseudomonas siliginis]TSB48837.1 hypothetical protein FEE99_28125 [Pseudomonas sp. ef1]UST97995.1 hypothetical protein NF679_13085 [Pseudomonas siliginis]
MGNFNKGLTCLLLIGSAASALISVSAQAEGNGVIVLNRDVQPIAIGRNGGKDPYPTTVNANPSARINQTLSSTELTDGDFASVASGSSIRGNMTTPSSNLPGMNTLTNQNGLPGMRTGSGGGSGASISNTVNRAMSTGLAPLTRMAGGQ